MCEVPVIFNISDFTYYNSPPVNLNIGTGICLGICGPSGSGKSLFLRALIDMEDHTGMVSLQGVNMGDMKPHHWRKQVAMLPAESHWWYDTVGEHFSDEQLDYASVGLTPDVMSWPVNRLSSGEKQRLALLRLLQNQPRVLLLDEPTSNLDKHHTSLVESLLKTYIREQQAAMIWVSHDEVQLQRMADKIYRIRNFQITEVTA